MTLRELMQHPDVVELCKMLGGLALGAVIAGFLNSSARMKRARQG